MYFRKCKGNVVDVAKAAGKFETLLKLLSELEVPSKGSMKLVDFLKSQYEVTVFAPTDEAFAKLPEGTLESLTKEQKLAIVSRHIVPGDKILINDVTGGPVETFGGETIELFVDDPADPFAMGISYEGNQIPVVNSDMASNGVIHVIDYVILPPPAGNVVDVAEGAGNFKTLLKILSELEVPNSPTSITLVDLLKSQREVTVFAPTDEAFAKLPIGTIESMTKEVKLTIFSRHFVPGVIILKADVTGRVANVVTVHDNILTQ